MSEYVQVVTTISSEQKAQRIATALVELRLAACAQVAGPIKSVYWWEGEIQSTEEWTCTLKTRRDRCEQIEELLPELHPYDVPEMLILPILDGSAAYLAWLERELIVRDEDDEDTVEL